jgi:P4 family phage/plasmid primase-like protien
VSTTESLVAQNGEQAHATPFFVTGFEHVKNATPIFVRDESWENFVAWIETNGHVRSDDRDADGALLGFYKLKDGTKSKNANVEHVFGWALDLDKLSQSQVDDVLTRFLEDGLAFVCYSTYSHSTNNPRLRVVGPLARPVAGKDWPPVWRAIVDKYSPGADEQCKDCRRLYWAPIAPPGVPTVLFDNPGAPLDPPAAKPAQPTAAPPRVDLDSKEVIDSGRKVERCPVDRTAFEHAEHLCRTLPPAVAGQGGSVALFRVARALVWGLELPCEQAEKLIGELYNSRCEPAWSKAEIDHKLADARAEVGAPYKRGALRCTTPVSTSLELTAETIDVMAQLHRTDAGNAERFALMHRENARYCTPRKRWLLWDGRRWAWDEREQVLELAKRTARAIWKEIDAFEPDSNERKQAAKNAIYAESRGGLTNMLALAGPLCATLPNEFDADPYAFNAQNGTIDLRTGELRPHRRDDLITKIAPVEFEPHVTSDLWDDCLRKFTGGDTELSAYLQRAIGYALLGQVAEKVFWFGFGPPNGGKSTFVSAVAHAFGDYAVATDADTWLRRRDVGGNRGDVVRLLGSRLVTCVEFKKGSQFDEKLIKGVTGGDMMTAAGKYEHDVSFLPQFALWFAANDAPTIHDDDEGMWARVRRVPFTASIPESQQDRSVRTRIQEPEHARAVLAWAVAGCLAWQRKGLGSCASIEASNLAYRREMDRVAPFFDARCEFGPEHETAASLLRQRYEDWCRDQRLRAVSPKEFAARLRARDCEQVKNSSMKWIGVRLT